MNVLCNKCEVSFCVVGDPEAVRQATSEPVFHFGFPCLETGCDGMMIRQPHLFIATKTVPLTVFLRSVYGFGKPGDIPASPENVRELCVGKAIQSLTLQTTGDPPRSIVYNITMDDGTKLHFASSNLGACIYNVEKPGPSCLEVFDENLAADARRAGSGPSSSREEAGLGHGGAGEGQEADRPPADHDGEPIDLPPVQAEGEVPPNQGG